MLIGLCGGLSLHHPTHHQANHITATCAGKHVVASYLTKSHGCIPIYYDTKDSKDPNPTTAADVDHTFHTISSLVTFVTKRWQRNYVLERISHTPILEALSKRPFFLLVSIDAPVSQRWQRLLASRRDIKTPSLTFEGFVSQSDAQMYHPTDGLARLMTEAQVKLINSGDGLETLYAAIDRLDLLDEGRLRPSWDQYFMQLASLAAQRSNCMKRRVGAVLVRERRVVSTGYNGTPRGLKNCNLGGCEFFCPPGWDFLKLRFCFFSSRCEV